MNTEQARRQMVEQQIRTWDVFDPDVLEAFLNIPKDRFVPEQCADVAYADTEIPLPHGQYMLRPNIVGRILQSVDIKPADDVLEIGTGTGYLTACLASLASTVSSIDIFPEFVESARKRLEELGIENVSLECMDAMLELPDGQFDVVIVTASLPELDDRFVRALKPGGRLFVVLGDPPLMRATLITRHDGDAVDQEALFETNVPRLIADWRPAAFSF